MKQIENWIIVSGCNLIDCQKVMHKYNQVSYNWTILYLHMMICSGCCLQAMKDKGDFVGD